ncbi:hypothetical protein HPB49_004632 [Dermacentor silvarum]|uniref:Uncharacterized protein n=1 Tax=Dermacentor silvarum TaxID=543639 RepID=A0ACB8CPW5_DERSI|nr:hypothetical protein HPB49_004632 [Dermacentor silvarum]
MAVKIEKMRLPPQIQHPHVACRFRRSLVGSVQNERQRNAAVGVLRRQFSNNTGDFLQFAVCSVCKEAPTSGKVPVMSVSNGYRYPPKPEHLRALNPVE